MSVYADELYKLCAEVWEESRPHVVRVSVHFVQFNFTLVMIFMILCSTCLVMTLCKHLMHKEPTSILIMVLISEFYLLIDFIHAGKRVLWR
jgi:hypothetical protein